MDEPHGGFKSFLLHDGLGHDWLWTVHIGTSGQGRACTRFHGVEVSVVDSSGLLARIHFMGDFGRAESSGAGDGDGGTALTPPQCPTQAQDARDDGSTGARQFSVNSIGNDQYEPWRLDHKRTVFGLETIDRFKAIVFNTVTAMTTCDGFTCGTVSETGAVGAGAFRVVQGFTNFHLIAPATAGNFTTDVLGRTYGGPVLQYIEPGLNIRSASSSDVGCVTPCNYWPGTDPNAADFWLRSNDPAVQDGKGSKPAYDIDGMLRLGN